MPRGACVYARAGVFCFAKNGESKFSPESRQIMVSIAGAPISIALLNLI